MSEEMKERVARVLEPHIFEMLDRHQDDCQHCQSARAFVARRAEQAIAAVDCDSLTTQLSQALRELGEAREMLKRAIDRENRLQDARDAAQRSTAELRGALEDCAAMAEARADSFIKTGEQIGWAERENWAKNMRDLAKAIRARTALASSSTKET